MIHHSTSASSDSPQEEDTSSQAGAVGNVPGEKHTQLTSHVWKYATKKSLQLHCTKKASLRTKTTFKRVQPLTNPCPRLFTTEKTSPNTFSDMSKSRPKTFSPPFFVSFLSHSSPLRVLYQLQMLKPVSTVFVTEQPHQNLPFRVLSTTQSTETRDFNPSFRNQRTLPVIFGSFDATLLLTQQNSS